MKTVIVFATALLCSSTCPAQLWLENSQLAIVYKDSGKIDSSLYYFQKALSGLPSDSADSDTRQKILKEIGGIYYYSKSNFPEALKYYQRVSQIILHNAGKNSNQWADNQFLVGQLQYRIKQNSNAERTYLQVAGIYRKNNGSNSKQFGDICNALGVLYNDWSRYDEAIRLHSEARIIRKTLFSDKDPSYAQSCNNLAAIYWNLGQLDKAEPLALEAKTIRQHSDKVKRFVYAISCVNLANIYRDMGKFKQAEELYIEARQLREAHFGRGNETYIESNDILSSLYSYMQRYNEAASLLVESMRLRDSTGNNQSFAYAQSASNLASAYMNLGKLQEAEDLALHALTIFKNIGVSANADIAITQNLLGNLYFAQHKNKAAAASFFKARKYWKKNLGEMHPFYNSSTLGLARIYRIEKNTKKAAAYYRRAFEADQFQLKNIFSFTGEQEKEQYLLNLRDNTGEYFSFYDEQLKNKNRGFAYDMLLNSKSRILFSIQELRNAVAKSKDLLIKEKYNEWISLKKQMATLYFGSGQNTQQSLAETRLRSQQLEKEIYRHFNNTGQAGLKWNAIPENLDDSQALVEFFNYDYFDGYSYTDSIVYAAFVVKQESKEPAWVHLSNKKDLEKAIAGSYTIDQDSSVATKRGVIKLKKKQWADFGVYKESWQPLAHELQGKNDIYIVPSGLLNRVSFPALNVDSNSLLSDHYRIQQVSSIKELGKRSFLNDTKREMVLYGGIQYGSSAGSGNVFAFLPGTEKEAGDIDELTKHLFTNIKYSGADATEGSFKKLDNHSPQIIHLATHGFYLPKTTAEDTLTKWMPAFFTNATDPLFRSGLAFANANHFNGEDSTEEDGILTAYEISGLDLSATKLVVLSACETALGDIVNTEGVYGLQRALKIAGVQYIIMSLWSVPDAETAAFMKAFYSALIEKKDISGAFYAAQTIFKNLYRNQPEKWAAWVLYQ